MLVGAYAGLYGWCTFTDGLPAHVKDNKAGTHFVPATPPGQPLARVGMMAGIAMLSAGAIIFVVATIAGKNSIGIGSPIAGAPSHTTVRTDRVHGDSAVMDKSSSK